MQNCTEDVLQFFKVDNPFRYIYPSKFTMQLKSEQETEEEKLQASPASTLDKETLKKLDPTKSLGNDEQDDDEEQAQIR